MHVQFLYPGRAVGGGGWHKLIGRLCFLSVTLGSACACLLAADHGPIQEYGGRMSEYGFYFMSLTVWVPAAAAVLAIRSGGATRPRTGSGRFALPAPCGAPSSAGASPWWS